MGKDLHLHLSMCSTFPGQNPGVRHGVPVLLLNTTHHLIKHAPGLAPGYRVLQTRASLLWLDVHGNQIVNDQRPKQNPRDGTRTHSLRLDRALL